MHLISDMKYIAPLWYSTVYRTSVMLANLQELLGTTNATAIDMAALNADENEKK